MWNIEKMMNGEIFDIFVVGGGHAGLEAAWMGQQFGFKVGMGTLPGVPLASTPCNPAIGGVGKGQVVREIDALGGLMGRIADLAGVQYRTLNLSKGHAVRSTRVQVDKDLYSQKAEGLIAQSSIKVIRRRVSRITGHGAGEGFQIDFKDGPGIRTRKLIVTAGTFLGGVLHTGEEQMAGGRLGARASIPLKGLFSQLSFASRRFKTGTPARLNKHSINYSAMAIQKSDPQSANFHFGHSIFERCIPQLSCHITRIGPEALAIIRANKERSPVFNGQITGIGPRYCPSIEDKAFRYPDRDSHQVFIEPEGHEAETVYPNGLSTSLPKIVQEKFYRAITGLENCQFEAYGHAVEYDVVDTLQLSRALEHRGWPGLYFAGQLNGTSGYEEAAGQGLVAGVNAAFALLGRSPFILDRKDSYIGVMIEDLVTQARDEPYRLFTSRAENRLLIREDNSIQRMWPYRRLMGLKNGIDQFQEAFLEEIGQLEGLIERHSSLKAQIKSADGGPVECLERELKAMGASFGHCAVQTVAISAKYEGYIQRLQRENEKISKYAAKKIRWESLANSPNICHECRQRIEQVRPETFGQLQKMPGIRPATLAYVAGGLV